MKEIVGRCADPACPEADKNVYRIAGTVYGKRVLVHLEPGFADRGWFHLNCGD